MAASQVKGLAILAAIVIAGYSAAVNLSASLERSRPGLSSDYADRDLEVTGSRLKGFAFGMEGLIADWYYMRSLQYIGNKLIAHRDEVINLDDLRALEPGLLYPLLDNATTLDPHFIGAFYYGALVLPAIDGDQAINLTQKGIATNPDAWQLYQHLGYIYWKLGDFDKAAQAYESGSQKPGAPPFMGLMTGAMRTEGGSRATAREIFRQMYEGSDDPAVQITAERRLAQLMSLDERDAIDAALIKYKEQHNECPTSLVEIMPLLDKVKLPANNAFRIDAAGKLSDPTGAPYLLDRAACQVTVDPQRTGLALK
jgi:tetratricopeptide (TPR) repeat protein